MSTVTFHDPNASATKKQRDLIRRLSGASALTRKNASFIIEQLIAMVPAKNADEDLSDRTRAEQKEDDRG